MALKLENGENSYDSYPLYGEDSNLVDPLEATKTRSVYFTYDSTTGGSLEADVLNGATALFYIPTFSTMLD
jgi:hypothetical protein